MRDRGTFHQQDMTVIGYLSPERRCLLYLSLPRKRLRSAYMTYKIWNCPGFSATLEYFLEAGLGPYAIYPLILAQ